MATDIEVIVDPAAISTAVTIDPASVVASVTLATGAPGPQGEVGPQGPAGQSFNQSLNTTDSPTFDEVTASTFSGKDGGIDSLGRPGSDGGKIYLNGDANGVFILEGEPPFGYVSGNAGTIDLRGGGTNPIDDTGNGGSLILCGGTGSTASAGSINTSGGNYNPGGSINTSAGAERGGSINTSNGGGNIDTSAGYIELGAINNGSVTTLSRTIGESTGYAIALPAANGTLALTTDAPASHTHPASDITDFAASVRAVVMTGLSTATSAAITATDSVLSALGKLQAQVSALASAGYQTAAQVTTSITSYGYQTASQVLAALTWSNISGKPSTFTASAHNHAASEITSGTLALARLDPLVALDNADNNFSVNQTFQGTNNVAPNQTAASGSSLMTRDLLTRQIGFAQVSGQTTVHTSATSGAGTAAGAVFSIGAQAVIGTTANSYGFSAFGDSFWTRSSLSGSAMPTNKEVLCFLRGVTIRVEANTNWVIRMLFGVGGPNRVAPTAGSAPLTSRAWCVEFYYNGSNYVWKPSYYNTSLVSGSETTIPGSITAANWTSKMYSILLRQTADGTLEFYINDGANSRLSDTPSWSQSVSWGATTYGGRSPAIECAAAAASAPASGAGIYVRDMYQIFTP